MPGLGALRKDNTARGVVPFWGKWAAAMEPKATSSRPRKLGHTALQGKSRRQAASQEPRTILSTHRAHLAGFGQSGPTDPRAERGEELQPGADPG